MCENINMDNSKTKIDFIGLGAEKAGTTWLSDALREHPEIFVPEEKELFYYNEFDPHFLEKKNPRLTWGLDWYLSKFKDKQADQICGEFSPTYLNCKRAARTIKKDFPQTKLIVTLRSPADRMVSQYYNDLKIGTIKKKFDFPKAIEAHLSYTEKSLYGKYLEYYLEHFEIKQIKIIFFEDIISRPKELLEDLYAWLGVSSNYQPSILEKASNPSRIGRFENLNRFMFGVENFFNQKLPFVSRLFDLLGIREAAIKLREINTVKIKKDPELKNKLPSHIKEKLNNDIKKLEKISNKNLANWFLK